MKKLLIAIGLFVTLAAPSLKAKAEDLIYRCDLRDGSSYHLSWNQNGDVFTPDFERPGKDPITKPKVGNDLGLSERLHTAEGVASAEIYFNTPEGLFTLGRMDRQGVISGYIEVKKPGEEETYEECVNKTFYSNFSNPQMFENFTVVD